MVGGATSFYQDGNANKLILQIPGGNNAAMFYVDDVKVRQGGTTEFIPICGAYDGLQSVGIIRADVADTALAGEACSLVKGNYDGTTDTDLFFSYVLPTNMRSGTTTVTISLIPSETVSNLIFATAKHAHISAAVPMNVLEQDRWNTITLVVDHSTNNNDLYVNGAFFNSTTAPIVDGALRILVCAANDNVNDIQLYMDNYMICKGALAIPPIDSDTLTVSGSCIYGCSGMTAAEMLSALTFSRDSYRAKITEKGVAVADDVLLTDDMVLTVWADDCFVSRYEMRGMKYEISGAVFLANGYEDDKFSVGTCSVEFDAKNYAGKNAVLVALTQYNADGSVRKEHSADYELDAVSHIAHRLNVEEAQNTYIEYSVTNSATGEVLIQSGKIQPYSDTRIERVSELFEGFTTKAATFGYDDGIVEDMRLIDIFDWYGAKGTFNLVGSRLENNFKTIAEQWNMDVYSAVRQVYRNHEIQNHTYMHKPSFLMEGETSKDSYGNVLTGCSLAEAIGDVTQNKRFLQEKLGAVTRGIAWPNGYPQVRTDYADLEQAVKADGYEFARYKESGTFALPDDWMRWQPTCHHPNAAMYTKRFTALPNSGDLKLYYIWGHAYEFANAGDDETKNWTLIENTLFDLYHNNVYFGTNSEIYDYIHALDAVAVTDTTVTNNSGQIVYLHINGRNVSINPQESYTAGEAGEELPVRPEKLPMPKIYIDVAARDQIAAYTEHDYGVLVMASYTAAGKLENIAISEEARLQMPVDNAENVKVFLFSSLQSLTPLTEPTVVDTTKYTLPTIACWGDSLTYGQESTDPESKSYPSVLAQLSGAEVFNMGVPGETAMTIAARQGSLKIQLSEAITIPASGSVSIKFKAANGGAVAPRDVSLGGWNPCRINGIEGALAVTIANTWPRTVASATFTRSSPGASVAVAAGTEIVPQSHSVKADINVIFSGTNGGWSTKNLVYDASYNSEEEIASMVAMLTQQARLSNQPDKYVIIGLTTYDDAHWAQYEAACMAAFGNRFFNLRRGLANETLLRSHGITPTAADMTNIARGAVPPSLLATDGTHFNDNGYRLTGELLYQKMQELQYLP